MPLAAKKRPLARVVLLVIVAVLLLHGLATWALLHLQMPDPKPIVSTPNVPIEIEMITLPSSLADSNETVKIESAATTSSVRSTANNSSQNNSSQNGSKRPRPQPSSTPAPNSAAAKTTHGSSKPMSNKPTANKPLSNKSTANRTTVNQPAAAQAPTNPASPTKPISTTANTKTNTKSDPSSQAPSQADNNASPAAPAAATNIETRTQIVSNPATTTVATNSTMTNNTMTNKLAGSEAALGKSAVTQDSQGQQVGKTDTSTVQTAGKGHADKDLGVGSGKNNDKHDAASVSAVAAGPFVFTESDATWRKNPDFNAFKKKLFDAYPDSTISVSVRVNIKVDDKGKITDVKIESGHLKANLDNQLIRTIMKGSFVPFNRGGRNVAGTVKLPIRFDR